MLVPSDVMDTIQEAVDRWQRAPLDNSLTESTTHIYKRGALHFQEFCETRNATQFPATSETVVAYIHEQVEEGKRLPTIRQRLASIRCLHELHGEISPTFSGDVKTCIEAIADQTGAAGSGQKPVVRPVTVGELHALAEACGNDVRGLRDRSLILTGFFGALTPSELSGLKTSQFPMPLLQNADTDGEVIVQVAGRPVRLPLMHSLCPVTALSAWLKHIADENPGALYRRITGTGKVLRGGLHRDSMRRIVVSAAERADIPTEGLSAMSLRAGYLANTVEQGSGVITAMKQAGLKVPQPLRGFNAAPEAKPTVSCYKHRFYVIRNGTILGDYSTHSRADRAVQRFAENGAER